MRQFLKSVVGISAVSAFIACGMVFLSSAKPASADTGLPEGYVGLGAGFGSGSTSAGLNGRISFPKTKISLRGSIYSDCSGSTCAALFIPTVTYDIGIADKTNLYLGGGVATAAVSDGSSTLSGSTGVLQAGLETGIGNKMAIYGDGTFGDGGTIWKVGLGYRF
jgi:hypothetical protein